MHTPDDYFFYSSILDLVNPLNFLNKVQSYLIFSKKKKKLKEVGIDVNKFLPFNEKNGVIYIYKVFLQPQMVTYTLSVIIFISRNLICRV